MMAPGSSSGPQDGPSLARRPTSCPTDGTHLQRYARVFRVRRSIRLSTGPRGVDLCEMGGIYSRPVPVCREGPSAHHSRPQAESHLADHFSSFSLRAAGSVTGAVPLLVQLPPSFAFGRARRREILRRGTGPLRWAGRLRASASHLVRGACDAPDAALCDCESGRRSPDHRMTHTLLADGMASSTFVCTVPPGCTGRATTELPLQLAWWFGGVVHVGRRWCVFDNTASGAALDDAWQLQQLLAADSSETPSRTFRPATLGPSLGS